MEALKQSLSQVLRQKLWLAVNTCIHHHRDLSCRGTLSSYISLQLTRVCACVEIHIETESGISRTKLSDVTMAELLGPVHVCCCSALRLKPLRTCELVQCTYGPNTDHKCKMVCMQTVCNRPMVCVQKFCNATDQWSVYRRSGSPAYR